jgi:hypothetical protein
MKRIVILGLALWASPAWAQSREDGWAPPEVDRNTSGAISLASGRTLGESEIVLAGGVGWPGAWVGAEYGVTSQVSLGARVGGDWGSPVMGLVTGGSGELLVPLRVHVFGEGMFDLALRAAIALAVGEGRALGEENSPRLSAQVGAAGRFELGARLAIQPLEVLTIALGVDASAGFAVIDPDPAHPHGLFVGTLALEGLVSRSLMLFGEIGAGAGVTEDRIGAPYFPHREIFRGTFGMAFLL